jgi:hypothetical protein
MVCPFKTPLILSLSEVFPTLPRPTATHFHYLRALWQLAKTLGLRNKRNIENVKGLIDGLKRFPFDKPFYIQQRLDKARDKNKNLIATFPKCGEFLSTFQAKFLLDNSKSEDFDVYPYRFWNLGDRVRKNLATFKALNAGAEFFHFMMDHFFDVEKLRSLDIRTIIDQLKLMEHEAWVMMSEAGNAAVRKEAKLKYKFMPMETQ